MQQPLLVMLKDPGTFRYFKRGGPQSEGKAAVAHQIRDVAIPRGKSDVVRGRILATRVLVSLIDLKVRVTQLLEVLGRASQAFVAAFPG